MRSVPNKWWTQFRFFVEERFKERNDFENPDKEDYLYDSKEIIIPIDHLTSQSWKRNR